MLEKGGVFRGAKGQNSRQGCTVGKMNNDKGMFANEKSFNPFL